MTALGAPPPVAVEHEGHPGPLLGCPVCRARASYGVFRRRYWALRARRGVRVTPGVRAAAGLHA